MICDGVSEGECHSLVCPDICTVDSYRLSFGICSIWDHKERMAIPLELPRS